MNINIEKELVNIFKLPIEYQSKSKKQTLNQNIITDLELINVIDNTNNTNNTNNKSIYENIFNPSNCFGELIVKKLPNIYTTNTTHLKETQQLLKNYSNNSTSNTNNSINTINYDDILNTYKEIKCETGFCEKYMYIEWEHVKFLNTNPLFLQILSIYSLASPLLSLFLPIILLVIPFFILKIKGIKINMDQYTTILKQLIGNHAIGKFFTKFNEVDVREKAYILMSVAFYFFSIYQNILTCIKFYNNINKIHNYIFKLSSYIDNSIKLMDNYLLVSSTLTTYKEFNQEVLRNKSYLENVLKDFNKITPFSISINKVFEIGHIMEQFYKIHNDIQFNSNLLFSFGFTGYIDCINGLSSNIQNGSINFTTFNKTNKSNKKQNKTNKSNNLIFNDAYYPALINSNPVKNTCNLSKNMIITGPNASGKTTILKTCLINVILSQQFGCGTYSSAKLTPFKHIHCYLNIPDTSGRDSLFQAEARRCKEIIDSINGNNFDTHFCVFDELYSGTNPDEAVVSATAFMKYLYSFKNVTSMLTTHYIELCKQLETNNNTINYHMGTVKNIANDNYNENNNNENNNTFNYTYILEKGISNVKGGFKVLADMDYPSEILNICSKQI